MSRVTLIRAVLQSIPIHCLAVLPVPKSILSRIERLLRSFLWGSGQNARRHWVNWKTVCLPINAGGLGIKQLKHVQQSLHGKLAWNYLNNYSLWATHARSRFKIGGKGSCLWKVISPIITSISLNCRWLLGNGRTLVSTFCQNISIPFPKRYKNMSIKEVISNPDLRRNFLHNMNPIIFKSIESILGDGADDKLIWEDDPSGMVSTSSFFKRYMTSSIAIKKFVIIWQSWIPPKVSLLMWKIFYNAIASDDRIMRLGYHMASKCVCCARPSSESLDHIFVHSDLAAMVINFLSPIFRKRKPITLYQLFYFWGLEADFSRFTDCLGFGLICCCIWDIWRHRNQLVYGEGAITFNKFRILRWASFLSSNIQVTPNNDPFSLSIFEALHISFPCAPSKRIFWIPWTPSQKGNTYNIAISVGDSKSHIGAIIRDRNGFFVAALQIKTIRKHFLRCLLHVLEELSKLKQVFCCIQLSHEEVKLLCSSSTVDWPVYQVKHKLIPCLRKFILHVSPALNEVCLGVSFRPALRVSPQVC